MLQETLLFTGMWILPCGYLYLFLCSEDWVKLTPARFARAGSLQITYRGAASLPYWEQRADSNKEIWDPQRSLRRDHLHLHMN